MIRKEKLIRFISKGYDKEMKKLLFNFSFNLFCWKINIPFMYIISLEQQCVLYEIVFSTQFINFELITTRDSSGNVFFGQRNGCWNKAHKNNVMLKRFY